MAASLASLLIGAPHDGRARFGAKYPAAETAPGAIGSQPNTTGSIMPRACNFRHSTGDLQRRARRPRAGSADPLIAEPGRRSVRGLARQVVFFSVAQAGTARSSTGSTIISPACRCCRKIPVQVGPDGSRTQGQFYISNPAAGALRMTTTPFDRTGRRRRSRSWCATARRDADVYPLSQTSLRNLLADHVDLTKDT